MPFPIIRQRRDLASSSFQALCLLELLTVVSNPYQGCIRDHATVVVIRVVDGLIRAFKPYAEVLQAGAMHGQSLKGCVVYAQQPVNSRDQ